MPPEFKLTCDDRITATNHNFDLGHELKLAFIELVRIYESTNPQHTLSATQIERKNSLRDFINSSLGGRTNRRILLESHDRFDEVMRKQKEIDNGN